MYVSNVPRAPRRTGRAPDSCLAEGALPRECLLSGVKQTSIERLTGKKNPALGRVFSFLVAVRDLPCSYSPQTRPLEVIQIRLFGLITVTECPLSLRLQPVNATRTLNLSAGVSKL